MQEQMSAADVAAHLAASHVRQSPTDCRARTAPSVPARRTTPADRKDDMHQLSWIDNAGSHAVPVNADFLAADPAGYLDAVRVGEMWNISVTNPDGQDVTAQYL